MEFHIDQDRVFVSPEVTKRLSEKDLVYCVYRHSKGDPGDGLSEDEVLDLLHSNIESPFVISKFLVNGEQVICISPQSQETVKILLQDELPEAATQQ